MANIISFPVRGEWSELERDALSNAVLSLASRGVEIGLDAGLSDEGEPWITIFDPRDGGCLGHIARQGAAVVLISPDGTVMRGNSMSRLLTALVDKTEQISVEKGKATF